MNHKILSEFDLISRLSKFQKQHKRIIKGIGDDCAVVRGRRKMDWLITTDAFVEGVHFDLDNYKMREAGKKAMGASLSDIAAMGGSPLFFNVSLGVPKKISQHQVVQFYRGLVGVARPYGAVLSGGNVSRSPDSFWASLTIVGEVARSRCKFRSGARPGDGIYVTGPLGVAAQKRYRIIPVPRLDFGRFLGEMSEVTSMIDVSDGLASDLEHILQASKCGAQLFYDQIPRAKGARAELVLSGGEDYELLFTAHPGAEKKLRRFYKIGEITREKGLKVLNNDGQEIKLKNTGHDHFKKWIPAPNICDKRG